MKKFRVLWQGIQVKEGYCLTKGRRKAVKG